MAWLSRKTSRVLPAAERPGFAADLISTRWCPVCEVHVNGRGVHQHAAYHCTPVECECPGPPPASGIGECSRCHRPQLHDHPVKESSHAPV